MKRKKSYVPNSNSIIRRKKKKRTLEIHEVEEAKKVEEVKEVEENIENEACEMTKVSLSDSLAEKTTIHKEIIYTLLSLNVMIDKKLFLVHDIIKSKSEIMALYKYKTNMDFDEKLYNNLMSAICEPKPCITFVEFKRFQSGEYDNAKYLNFLNIQRKVIIMKSKINIYWTLYKHIESICLYKGGLSHFHDQIKGINIPDSGFKKYYNSFEQHASEDLTFRSICRIILYIIRPYKSTKTEALPNVECTKVAHLKLIKPSDGDFDTMDLMYGCSFFTFTSSKTFLTNKFKVDPVYKKTSVYFREAMVNIAFSIMGFQNNFSKLKKSKSEYIPKIHEVIKLMEIVDKKKSCTLHTDYELEPSEFANAHKRIDVTRVNKLSNTFFSKVNEKKIRSALIIDINGEMIGYYTDSTLHDKLLEVMKDSKTITCMNNKCKHRMDKKYIYCPMCSSKLKKCVL